MTDRDLHAMVAELRHEFDRSFTAPPQARPAHTLRILKLRLGGRAYGIALHEVQAVDRLGTLQPLPGGGAGFLGLAGSRGAIVAVYDLAALLDVGAGTQPRWLVICPGSRPIGLAADDIEGCATVSAPSAGSNPRADALAGPGRETIAIDGVRYQMINVQSILARLLAEAQSTVSERSQVKWTT